MSTSSSEHPTGSPEPTHGQAYEKEPPTTAAPQNQEHEPMGQRYSGDARYAAQQPYGSQPSTPYDGGQYGAQHSGGQYSAQQYGSPTNDAQPYGAQQYGSQHGSGGQPGSQQYGGQPYGSPQYTQPYGAPSYGQQYTQQGMGTYAQAPYAGAPQAIPFASWGSRVGAYLLDALMSLVPMLLIGGLGLWMAFKDSYTLRRLDGTDEIHGISASGFAIAGLGWLLTVAFQLWNRGARQGKTGQSLGKKMVHIKVLDEQTGRPAGTGKGIGRALVEVGFGIVGSFVGGVLSLLDYLWPLWDDKSQALHDKALHTVVVRGD